MARKDNAPVGHTCPMIDDVINFLSYIAKSENEDIAKEAIEMQEVMEKIRTANDKLRTWGNECNDNFNDIESDLDSAKERIERLEDENKYLIEDLVEAKNTIDNLKYEIQDLERDLDLVNN
jgi:predicted nuclease with TOPRIM domain